MSSSKAERNTAAAKPSGFRAFLHFLSVLTTPFWKGWSLIFKGDSEYPQRHHDWSRNQEVTVVADPKGPWIFWIGGYSASVSPFRPLITSLCDSFNVNIKAISLAGHTGSYWDFARVRAWHWYADAERRFLKLYEQAGGRPIVLAGISTGGLVACQLAARHPDKVRAMVLDANALKLASPSNSIMLWVVLSLYYIALTSPIWALPLFGGIPWFIWLLFCAGLYATGLVLNSHLVPPEVRLSPRQRLELYHNWLPLITTANLPLAQMLTRFSLPAVRCPTLICHGSKDDVIPVEAAKITWNRIGSTAKWLRIFKQSSHPVLLGPERDDYLKLVINFVLQAAQDGDPNRISMSFDPEWHDPLAPLQYRDPGTGSQETEETPDLGDLGKEEQTPFDPLVEDPRRDKQADDHASDQNA